MRPFTLCHTVCDQIWHCYTSRGRRVFFRGSSRFGLASNSLHRLGLELCLCLCLASPRLRTLLPCLASASTSLPRQNCLEPIPATHEPARLHCSVWQVRSTSNIIQDEPCPVAYPGEGMERGGLGERKLPQSGAGRSPGCKGHLIHISPKRQKILLVISFRFQPQNGQSFSIGL